MSDDRAATSAGSEDSSDIAQADCPVNANAADVSDALVLETRLSMAAASAGLVTSKLAGENELALAELAEMSWVTVV
eukprot:4266011-Prymnesium_polylepis.2